MVLLKSHRCTDMAYYPRFLQEIITVITPAAFLAIIFIDNIAIFCCNLSKLAHRFWRGEGIRMQSTHLSIPEQNNRRHIDLITVAALFVMAYIAGVLFFVKIMNKHYWDPDFRFHF